MNKQKALVTLIKTSLFLGPTEKLILLETVPTMDDEQVIALGTYLATLRKTALYNREEMLGAITNRLNNTNNEGMDAVYVGIGRP